MKNIRKASKLKNRGSLFLVVRVAEGGKEVVTAATDDYDKANELMGEQEQLMRDKGFTEEEIHYYLSTTTYYA